MIELPGRRECRVNGAAISYLAEGQGEPFVMIHGLMANAVDFLFQFREFSGGFTCIAPDLRGHGLSRGGEDDELSLRQAVEDMEALIDEVAPDGKITLMGHSYGGMVAQELIARIPERLRRVIIVASPADIGSKPYLGVGIDLINLLIPLLKPLISHRAIDLYTKWINIPPWSLNEDLRELLRLRNDLVSSDDLVALGRYFDSMKDWQSPGQNGDAAGGAADVPVMIVFGQNDLIVHRSDMEDLKRRYPGARCHVVKGTRHSPLNEKPEIFNDLLKDFFQET